MTLLRQATAGLGSSSNYRFEVRTIGKVNDHTLNHAFLVKRQKFVGDRMRKC